MSPSRRSSSAAQKKSRARRLVSDRLRRRRMRARPRPRDPERTGRTRPRGRARTRRAPRRPSRPCTTRRGARAPGRHECRLAEARPRHDAYEAPVERLVESSEQRGAPHVRGRQRGRSKLRGRSAPRGGRCPSARPFRRSRETSAVARIPPLTCACVIAHPAASVERLQLQFVSVPEDDDRGDGSPRISGRSSCSVASNRASLIVPHLATVALLTARILVGCRG